MRAVVAAVALLLLHVPAAAQPSPCLAVEDIERVRKLMLDGVEEGFKQHVIHLFDNWLKDGGGPERAVRGLRNGVKAYMGSRAAALRWAPRTC